MNVLPSHRHEPALMDAGEARTSARGIRDLLRDTALLVTTLAGSRKVDDPVGFRSRCEQIIDQFSGALGRRGYPDDVRHDAVMAQCALLDETALRYLPPDVRADWELAPLQVGRFSLHDAGERVFERLEARMREAAPHIDLLECYAAILGIGFTGRYAREGEAKRAGLISSLNAQLEKLRPSADRPFVVDRAGRRFSDLFYRLSPWAVAGLACLVAAIVWGAWSTALDLHVAQLAPAKALRP